MRLKKLASTWEEQSLRRVEKLFKEYFGEREGEQNNFQVDLIMEVKDYTDEDIRVLVDVALLDLVEQIHINVVNTHPDRFRMQKTFRQYGISTYEWALDLVYTNLDFLLHIDGHVLLIQAESFYVE